VRADDQFARPSALHTLQPLSQLVDPTDPLPILLRAARHYMASNVGAEKSRGHTRDLVGLYGEKPANSLPPGKIDWPYGAGSGSPHPTSPD
jgi:hypothetical protein